MIYGKASAVFLLCQSIEEINIFLLPVILKLLGTEL